MNYLSTQPTSCIAVAYWKELSSQYKTLLTLWSLNQVVQLPRKANAMLLYYLIHAQEPFPYVLHVRQSVLALSWQHTIHTKLWSFEAVSNSYQPTSGSLQWLLLFGELTVKHLQTAVNWKRAIIHANIISYAHIFRLNTLVYRKPHTAFPVAGWLLLPCVVSSPNYDYHYAPRSGEYNTGSDGTWFPSQTDAKLTQWFITPMLHTWSIT